MEAKTYDPEKVEVKVDGVQVENGFRPPTNRGDALREFKAGSSQFLRGLIIGIYGWSFSKVLPDFVAIYGMSMEDAAARGLDSLRHGLAVYVAAIYHGMDVQAPDKPEALSAPMAGYIRGAWLIREKRAKLHNAKVRETREEKAEAERRRAARKRERQARAKARR